MGMEMVVGTMPFMLFTAPNVGRCVNNIICSSNLNGVRYILQRQRELHCHSFYTLAELWGDG